HRDRRICKYPPTVRREDAPTKCVDAAAARAGKAPAWRKRHHAPSNRLARVVAATRRVASASSLTTRPLALYPPQLKDDHAPGATPPSLPDVPRTGASTEPARARTESPTPRRS